MTGESRRPTGPDDYSYLNRISEAEWGYLAGILVGEGHLGIYGTVSAPQFRLEVQIGDQEVCNHLAGLFGGVVRAGQLGGVTYRRHDGIRRTFTNMYRWVVIDGYLIREIMQRTIPYLQGNKLTQARRYADFVDAKLMCWEHKRQQGRSIYTEEEQRVLLRLAYEARKTALGGRKSWLEVWEKRLQELENAGTSNRTQEDSLTGGSNGTN